MESWSVGGGIISHMRFQGTRTSATC